MAGVSAFPFLAAKRMTRQIGRCPVTFDEAFRKSDIACRNHPTQHPPISDQYDRLGTGLNTLLVDDLTGWKHDLDMAVAHTRQEPLKHGARPAEFCGRLRKIKLRPGDLV